MSSGTPDSFRELDIAVIGLSCRLPKSPDAPAYWRNLHQGVECISFFSEEELRAEGVPEALFRDPDYVPAAGVLDDVARFDAELFGYLPREAMLLDPQQRVFLECAWAALEDAGYAPRGIGERRAGVFAGATMNTYLVSLLLADPSLVEKFGEQTVMHTNDKDFLPLRASYKLGLTGASVNIQAACATSLVAVHEACRSLLSGESDIALAGGASVRVPHRAGYRYREQGTSSPDGHCRPFDADADGSVPGSGVGVVVLKRFADALADGDAIRAVIKGSAISNDGAGKGSFTAPSADGQTRAIVDAFTNAQISAETVSYVECHGTATKLGDPIEISGLTRAFREMTDGVGFCAIGSVKPNIGHLDAAAGVASLIKTVLALEHRLIPPTLNFRQANPELRLEESPFRVVDRPTEWQAGGTPRRAGINSIGMGGVNAHVLVEEAPARRPAPPTKRRWLVLPLSAHTPTALAAGFERLSGHLAAAGETPLADAAYTLQTGRAALGRRRAVVCEAADWERALAAAARTPGVAVAERPTVLFLFPGQAVTSAPAAAGLYAVNGAFRDAFDACARAARNAGGPDLLPLLAAGGATPEQMRDTAVAQVALFTIGWATAMALAELGIAPDRLVGHSLGELVAATLAGVFSLEDAVALVVERGRLMQAAPEGAMTAVAAAEERLAEELGEGLSLAAVNAPGRCVVSGARPVVEAFERRLAERGILCKRLDVARAFHSPMMSSAAVAFEQAVGRHPLNPPQKALYSTVTGQRLTAAEATSPAYWGRQMRETVQLGKAVAAATMDARSVLAVECGPGGVLAGHARRTAPAVESLAALPEERSLQEVAARAWELGLPVRWSALHADESRRRVSLPSYPFEGKRAWIDAPRRAPAAAAAPEPAERPAEAAPAAILTGPLHTEISVHPDRIVIRTMPAAAVPLPAAAGAAAPPVPSAPPPGAVATPPPPRAAGEAADVESRIAGIVEDLLGISGVDRHARLTDLGADSLLLTQLLTRLRKAVAPGLTMGALTRHGSITQLAELVRAGAEAGAPPPVRPAAPPAAAAESDGIEDLLLQLRDLSPAEIENELSLLSDAEAHDD